MDVPISPFNQKMIVRYLLGELPENQQVEIEDQAFQDQEYLQNIQAVENDLIDEYVRGEIPPHQRQKFESHFLASAERRRKLEFARALGSVTSESETLPAVQSFRARTTSIYQNSLLAFIRSLKPAMAFSMAAVALVVLIGAALLIRDGIRLRSQLGQLQAERQSQEARRQQLEKEMANERARNEELARQVEHQQQEESAREPQREERKSVSTPSLVVALTLLPGLSRGSNSVPSVVVSPAVRTVLLQVGVDPQDDYPRYRIEIHSPSGKQIWAQDKLSSRATRIGRAIVLNLPASLLEGGRYELSVKGTSAAGTSEDIGYYYFEVLKK